MRTYVLSCNVVKVVAFSNWQDYTAVEHPDEGSLSMAIPQQAPQAAAHTPRTETIEFKNYSLRERIGQTELAIVYQAQHQTLDQVVHVHILRRSGWIAISRF